MDEVWAALEKLQADLQRYEFGRSILYDGAKYLHRAFERWAAVEIDDVNPYIFEDPEKANATTAQNVKERSFGVFPTIRLPLVLIYGAI